MRLRSGHPLVALCSVAVLSACAIPYKPFDGTIPNNIGYTVEFLAMGEYHVEYHGGSSDDFARMELLLRRYVDELCLTAVTLGEVEHEVFRAVIIADGAGRSTNYSVSAPVWCDEIDMEVANRSRIYTF